MKILVPVKRVIDAYVKVRVNADQTAVDLTNAKMAMNPFCEIAVEEAVRLKEKGTASEVIVISIGGDKCQEQLRNALALGADRAIHVSAEDGLEPLAVAKVLQHYVAQEQPGLVILGKQSIDTDNNQVGQMLAALCDMPQGTFAFSLEIQDGKALVGREIDGGEQVLSLALPAVVTTDLRLNEPRYAKLPDIMKARKKELDTVNISELGISTDRQHKVLSVREPADRQAGIIVDSVESLVDKLRNEAKVL